MSHRTNAYLKGGRALPSELPGDWAYEEYRMRRLDDFRFHQYVERPQTPMQPGVGFGNMRVRDGRDLIANSLELESFLRVSGECNNLMLHVPGDPDASPAKITQYTPGNSRAFVVPTDGGVLRPATVQVLPRTRPCIQ